MTENTPQRRATLRDVARDAGVSIATASKALNGRKEVAEDTRERVREAAEALRFTPNSVARSLLSRRTGTVGLLTGDLEGRFVIPILMGAEDAFGAGRNNVFLCDARGDSIRERYHLNALLERRVDGIIVVGRQTDPRRSLGQDLPVPVVYAYAPSDDDRDLSLTPDNESGGAIATEHLLSLGRRRIAHITGDPQYVAARDRARGFLGAMHAAGLEPCGAPMFAAWTEQWGRDAAATLFEQYPEVDGVVCGSDQIARGVIDTLRDLGKTVPDDVAIVSHDNWEVLATGSRPSLTSVDANLQDLGRLAARKLFDALSGEDVGSGVHRLPVTLVTRGSSVRSRA
ncbi:LacI family DNA-binding transcriptional regulator [Ruania halotolerans]|uniref:LacI family DNA-binding transcriptional regulator n=1 Tax=Ruania halotolerans TaxID=2897773 RepID=UPI001E4FF39F|nr:LacI family DNA-binding transcriptional regulator [Ruania halotolerans]UFU06858.1 LacI family transcriptional regulator [Ruania halotolerans]